MQSINKTQTSILKKISDGKQHECSFDKRTIGALVRRDFVKLISNKKGEFVKITAKGKKVLN